MDNMNKKASNFTDYFKELYTGRSYLDKYSGDIMVTSTALFGFFIAISYYYVMSQTEPIKADWNNQKCHPAVMPFAGIIMNPPNKSKMEYTNENFAMCVNKILADIVHHFVQPLYYLTDNVTVIFKKLASSVQVLRKLMAWLREKFKKIVQFLIGRILGVFIPIQKILMNVKDAMAKASGIMAAALYTAMAAFMAMKSFIASFLHILIAVLIISVAAIIILWLLPFTWPAAAAGTAFFLLISIPTAIIAAYMGHILNLTTRSVPPKPGKPSCFDKNTSIETANGFIKISKLKPGMILKNGEKITATFKCALNNQKMFNINNIIVSDNHKIFHDKYGWIRVDKHPDAVLIKDYREEFIYCLNTETKRIVINNTAFLDWDELEPIDIIKLKNLNYLSHNCSISNVHKKLDSGLYKNSKIELEDGHVKSIKNIKVNDQLKYGERVLAVVKILGKDIHSVKKYIFNNYSLIGSSNIIINDYDLGKFTTLNKFGTHIDKQDYLYHLITDTGTFTVNNIKIQDYNSAIENIIDKRDELFNII